MKRADTPVRILMVEDSALDVELALNALRSAGIRYECEAVQDRKAFDQKLQATCPDLILSEVSMPGFDGYTALTTAQEHCPGVPFLFVSGAMGEEIVTESLKRGATDFVLKQKLERLPPAVLRALREAGQHLERRRAEEELTRKARELTVLNEDLQQFAYAASHDLQEPLRTIALFSKLLSTRYKSSLDGQGAEYLGYIEEAARHMSSLLENLLIYARIPAQDRNGEQVDLGQLLDSTLFLFQATLKESKGKVTRGELPTVPCNAAQLELVFQNLISNALKYRGSDPPDVRIEAVEDGDRWMISVRDNGIGFEQTYADQVFGLFKRLNNRDFPGTGLGLAICKRIVEIYGGKIWVESKLGCGSTFFFSLPAGARAETEQRERVSVETAS